MPTGYTAAIEDGGITFEEYAMRCARAFGACVTMRDEQWDAPIPERFEPSDFYSSKIIEAAAELGKVDRMTPEEAETAAQSEHDAEMQSAREILDKKLALKAKYEQMLGAVDAWRPPTGDHAELKSFMADQIKESIRFDCDNDWWSEKLNAKPKPGIEWRMSKIAVLKKELAYHANENRAEIARCDMRTAWVKALRESLRGART